VLPVDLLRAPLHQRLAIARELAQVADRRGRDETRLDQAVAQQVRQPLAILHVGLAPGHGLHVLRVDQRDGAGLTLQDVVDRPPVHAGRLQRDLRHPVAVEPVAQGQEVRRHRAERLHPALHRAVGRGDEDAGDDCLVVHIEPAAARVDHLHRPLPS